MLEQATLRHRFSTKETTGCFGGFPIAGVVLARFVVLIKDTSSSLPIAGLGLRTRVLTRGVPRAPRD